MNETTPPPGTPAGGAGNGTGHTGPTGPGGLDRFFVWLRGIGIVRGADRWFAGVAGGIAAKAGIDPLIVRGVFVVLAVLGGPGLLLYLAAWLLLPDASGRIHFEEVVRGRASTGVIVTAVLLGVLVFLPVLFGLLPGLFVGSWGWNAWGILPEWLQVVFGVLWWAVLLPAGIIWAIVWFSSPSNRARGSRPASPADGSAPPAPGVPGADASGAFPMPSGAPGGEAGSTGTDWGEKTEQWNRKLQEQSREWEQWGREYHEHHRLGAAYVAISLALALLAGGVAAAWSLALGLGSETTLTIGLVSTVVVLALSTILAGIRGRDSGWVGFFGLCGVVALILAPFSTLMPEDTRVAPFGNAVERVAGSDGDSALLVLAGNPVVDLTGLDRDDPPRVVDVWVAGGTVTVELPDAHPTIVQANVFAGNIEDRRPDDERRGRGGLFASSTIEQATAGRSDDEITRVNVRLLGGEIRVEGGGADTMEEIAGYEERKRLEEQERKRLEEEARQRAEEIERLEKQIEELENSR